MAFTSSDSGEGRRSSRVASLAGKFKIPIAAILVLAVAVGVAWLVPMMRSSSAAGPFGSGGGDSADPTSFIANAKGRSIPVYDKPGAAKPSMTLSNPTDVGARRVFLVQGNNGNGWIHVLLPTRPNGSDGWVRDQDVTVTTTTYRVHVYLSDYRVVVKHGEDETVVKGPIGIGKQENTPTPDGQYYITSLLKPPKENSVYGAYAFGLSGFSNVLKSFSGGPGRIGLHGTNKPQLLGQDVSAGCIRMSNANITKLAGKLPLGTPVYVHA